MIASHSNLCAQHTLISLTLHCEHGNKMNVFDAPGLNTKSDATLIACETSVVWLPLPVRI